MFEYLVLIDPLGLLYASSGPFLSPENLVGQASQDFPPNSTTFAGLMAAYLSEQYKGETDKTTLIKSLEELFVAGPFWTFKTHKNQKLTAPSFCVPTPFCYLSELTESKQSNGLSIPTGTIVRLHFQESADEDEGKWLPKNGKAPDGKYESQTWIPIHEWENPQRVFGNPWINIPHLHPRLREDERRVMVEEERGSLFLENAIQLNPNVCLAYLSNTHIEEGWYRFGGEGHMVNLTCIPLDQKIKTLLSKPLGKSFATITRGVWGSNRLSRRYPQQWDELGGKVHVWTERAKSHRFRLGGAENQVKRLSRGRYAVPAGTIYKLPKEINAWQEWHSFDHSQDKEKKAIDPEQLKTTWFPIEGYSYKHWGCGLALPITV